MPELTYYIRLAMEVITAGCSTFTAVLLACCWYKEHRQSKNLPKRPEVSE
ncbi:MAG: hypothetical protein ACOX6U_09120 [Oscillospiraceae bacterium]